MKFNERTRICGKKVVLVPYERCHVPKYHDWMKSEELQILTASEPLTLEQEFEMQKSWRLDENKSMIGDVNLFFNDPESPHSAEIEIMIAESWARGQGSGKEALCSMMRYGVEKLEIKTFNAKVGVSNSTSLGLLERLGFKEVSRSDVFQEVTLELPVMENLVTELESWTPSYKLTEHQC